MFEEIGSTRELNKLQLSVIWTFCNQERAFLLTFFDVMIHEVVHLDTGPKLVEAIQYRWMYPIVRLVSGYA